MLNKRLIYLIVLPALAVLALIVLCINSIIIGDSKTGQVIDVTSNSPIREVTLVRITEVKVPCFHCDGIRKVRTEVTQTDTNGMYNFESFFKIKSPFNSFYRELLYVNDRSKPFYDENDVDLNLQHNRSYESTIIGLGFSGNPEDQTEYVQKGKLYQPFKSETTIRLSPLLSELSRCNGNEQCIAKNIELERYCEEIDNYSLECEDLK